MGCLRQNGGRVPVERRGRMVEAQVVQTADKRRQLRMSRRSDISISKSDGRSGHAAIIDKN